VISLVEDVVYVGYSRYRDAVGEMQDAILDCQMSTLQLPLRFDRLREASASLQLLETLFSFNKTYESVQASLYAHLITQHSYNAPVISFYARM
jgi:hypothetical protein